MVLSCQAITEKVQMQRVKNFAIKSVYYYKNNWQVYFGLQCGPCFVINLLNNTRFKFLEQFTVQQKKIVPPLIFCHAPIYCKDDVMGMSNMNQIWSLRTQKISSTCGQSRDLFGHVVFFAININNLSDTHPPLIIISAIYTV